MEAREGVEPDEFQRWLQHGRRKKRGGPQIVRRSGLRFAFYGRTSTTRFQDQQSSRGWQRETAEVVIADHGAIVAEFFDAGCSRQMPWHQRPKASALLAAANSSKRPFDAIVVGEYERAFVGDQFEYVATELGQCGVKVWLPEAGGPVDLDDPTHHVLMTVLGAQSQREVLRSRYRVLAAMRTQTREQGRYLGGRPPYGYRLVDAGPHPNRAHAAWGRRLQRLDPDPVTAPHVRWIFAERLAGRSIAGIARWLNEKGVACPSSADRQRNPHRSAHAWTVQTVAVILNNPRYTGRQVWQRSSGARSARTADSTTAPREGLGQEWAVSEKVAHPELVSERDFVAAQAVRASRPTKDGRVREYLCAGLLVCRMCGRRMDAHWVNGRPGYRCRHGYNSSQQRGSTRGKGLYVREDRAMAALAAWFPGSGPLDMLRCLRRDDLVVLCDPGEWELVRAEDAAGPIQSDFVESPGSGPDPFMG
ncbi:putative recombinase [Nocardiopsis kunsanensis]|uniref:Recombinase n=1 Tax=Nocardiopsis kunsanensis TaxID=141693 RepID=A0A918XDX6_9ACTN|nr:recombinase family protein [Nocardiopsis kunsanensis]GHD28162.1 putative recombinase [Nocardiopsis kunsanensis]